MGHPAHCHRKLIKVPFLSDAEYKKTPKHVLFSVVKVNEIYTYMKFDVLLQSVKAVQRTCLKRRLSVLTKGNVYLLGFVCC